jgi:outer membrane biosynthesis protein TonB
VNFKQFLIFIGISLLLHLFLLGLAFSSFFAPLFSGLNTPDLDGAKQMTLTMMPSPKPKGETQIIDTDQSIPTNTPADNTPFEGDRNTLASSAAPGQGNPNLPSNKGKNIPGQDLYNQRYSPNSTPQPPAPPVKQQQEQKPPDQQKPEKPADKPEQTKMGQRDVTIRQSGQLAAGEQNTSRPPSQNPAMAQQPSEPRPAASFSSSRIASSMEGGAPDNGAPSIAVKETEEGRYKVKMYRAIGTRWYQYVHMDTGLLNIGTVKIKFYVRSDGTITDLQIATGQDNSALVAISRRSILEVSGQLEPFSPGMKEKMGDGFWDDVNFSIY